jgi:hypothetical protein
VTMAKAFYGTGRRRGNPNWGQPAQVAPLLATEFEKQVQQLGLTKQTCAASAQLRNWCERNCNRCYVPEWLLGVWGIDVEETFCESWSRRSSKHRGLRTLAAASL